MRSALNTSPLSLANREENCHNCGGAFSPSHQCDGVGTGGAAGALDGKTTCTCDCKFPICCNCQHEQENRKKLACRLESGQGRPPTSVILLPSHTLVIFPLKQKKSTYIHGKERSQTKNKNSFEICEQNATSWQHAKFEISNFAKIRITLLSWCSQV